MGGRSLFCARMTPAPRDVRQSRPEPRHQAVKAIAPARSQRGQSMRTTFKGNSPSECEPTRRGALAATLTSQESRFLTSTKFEQGPLRYTPPGASTRCLKAPATGRPESTRSCPSQLVTDGAECASERSFRAWRSVHAGRRVAAKFAIARRNARRSRVAQGLNCGFFRR
jgi:hypothetical protein